MAGRFVCNLIHFVWSTNGRREWIQESWEDELHSVIGGIVRYKSGTLLAADRVLDHLHLLVAIPPKISISEIVGAIKANSSRWIHQNFPEQSLFRWQEGYGAFSVSRSNEETVKQYIDNQKDHHRKRSFQEEFLNLLERHGIEYDPEFIWM